jgi:hypothetical protein
MFNDILVNISYHNDFIEKSKLFIDNNINEGEKINIIHLRLEDDGIKHWSKINKINPDIFKKYLETKYINIIKKYVSKDEINIILSSSYSNEVINYIHSNGYNYKYVSKYFEDREKNAIIDLLISKYYNNIFIGNFNINMLNGSSFSYYIWKVINNNITKIYIDLDKIYDDEVIYK